MLPFSSTAVHVTVVIPNGYATGALLDIVNEQLSETLGVDKTIPVASQPELVETITIPGVVITGLVISLTKTVCVALAVFPLPSVTVHVTVVKPSRKVVGALLVTLTTLQLSAVTGVPRATLYATHPLFAFTVTFDGAAIVGTTVSITVTVCVAVAKLPLPSTTVQVMVVVPIGNDDGALFVTLTTEQLSAVIAAPNTTLVATHDVELITKLVGAVMVGKVTSTTLTICVAVAVLPLASVTVQVTVVVPNINVDGAVLVTLNTVQLSKATGVPKATLVAPHNAFAFTTTIEGATIVGLTVSFTVTVCTDVAVLPEASVTVHVTVVTPVG